MDYTRGERVWCWFAPARQWEAGTIQGDAQSDDTGPWAGLPRYVVAFDEPSRSFPGIGRRHPFALPWMLRDLAEPKPTAPPAEQATIDARHAAVSS